MKRAVVLAVILAVGALASPAVALMHLELERSAPAADEQLAAAPEELRLWFSQKPEPAVSMIRVDGPAGAVELGDITAGAANDLAIALPASLPAGAYTVTWRTSSGDGHPIRGSFGFTVTGR